MVAALFVETNGVYYGLPDVDPWDQARDARLYAGPWPVVAHPPCARWCRLAGLVEARYGHPRGQDDGCFGAALRSVRIFGGVLEHPAYSDAWPAFGLPIPPRDGGWQKGLCGGWSCQVEQSRYGHAAKKATWLYCYGVVPPPMRWGFRHDHKAGALVSWCGNHVRSGDVRPRIGKTRAQGTPPNSGTRCSRSPARYVERMCRSDRSRTPPAFRDALLEIARNVIPTMTRGDLDR